MEGRSGNQTCQDFSEISSTNRSRKIQNSQTSFHSTLMSSASEGVVCDKCGLPENLNIEYSYFEISKTKVLTLNMGGQGYSDFPDKLEIGGRLMKLNNQRQPLDNVWILRAGIELHLAEQPRESQYRHYTTWYRHNKKWIHADDKQKDVKHSSKFKTCAKGIVLAFYERTDRVS